MKKYEVFNSMHCSLLRYWQSMPSSPQAFRSCSFTPANVGVGDRVEVEETMNMPKRKRSATAGQAGNSMNVAICHGIWWLGVKQHQLIQSRLQEFVVRSSAGHSLSIKSIKAQAFKHTKHDDLRWFIALFIVHDDVTSHCDELTMQPKGL